MTETVNHPDHYTAGGMEVIDILEAKLTPEQFQGFCLGNVLKYLLRAGHKGGVEDLRKAQWYLARMLGEKTMAEHKQEKREELHTLYAKNYIVAANEERARQYAEHHLQGSAWRMVQHPGELIGNNGIVVYVTPSASQHRNWDSIRDVIDKERVRKTFTAIEHDQEFNPC